MADSLTDVLTRLVFVEDAIEKADIIFIPGNGYPQMAEEAARLYKEGYAPYVLPSGRYYIYDTAFDGVKAHAERYPGPYETEWGFLKDVLIKNGVPLEAILKEDQSTYTYQNAIFSRKVTDEKGLTVRKAIICCLSSHARRCSLYYSLLFPEATIMVHPTPANGISCDNWMLSETGIDTVTDEASRCGGQFKDILKEMYRGNSHGRTNT